MGNTTECIKNIYDENIQWLNFAEVKNGVLLTLMTAIIGMILQMDICIYLKMYFAVFSAIIAFVALFSFVPFLNKNMRIREHVKSQYSKDYKGSLLSGNVVFYIEVFVDGKEKYREALIRNLNLGAIPFNMMEENYIEQIVHISAIASIKYYMFRIGVELFSLMTVLAGVCTFFSILAF